MPTLRDWDFFRPQKFPGEKLATKKARSYGFFYPPNHVTPRVTAEEIMSPKLREFAPSLVAGGLLLLAVAFYAMARYGSISNAISAWRNEQVVEDLVVELPNQSVGSVEAFSPLETKFTITNQSKKPISIVGDYIACNCLTCDTVWPVQIEPASKIQFYYGMRSPAAGEKFSQKIILYTDSATHKEIPLSISGEARQVPGNDPALVEPVKDIR